MPAEAAGDAAFAIFCRPELSDKRSPNYRVLSERARFHLRHAVWSRIATPVGEVQAYTFEPSEAARGTVLVVHGWSSEASFMTALAEPIRRAGFRVVLFDLPGHGKSAGRRTNLVDCAKATLAVGELVGPLHTVVAHSFGGMIALLAAEGYPPMPRALACRSFVTLACPNRLADITGAFGQEWAMTDAGLRAFERRLERVGWRSLRAYSTAALLASLDCKVLVVHDKADEDVPFSCAEEIASTYEGAELAAFDGFGHRNLLFAPPVVRRVIKRLTEA